MDRQPKTLLFLPSWNKCIYFILILFIIIYSLINSFYRIFPNLFILFLSYLFYNFINLFILFYSLTKLWTKLEHSSNTKEIFYNESLFPYEIIWVHHFNQLSRI